MRILVSLLACWMLSACVFSRDYIDVPYEAATNLSVIDGASATKIAVVPSDGRSVYRDRVSVKKNGYGMEMASIVAKNDIAETVGHAFEKELSSMGFSIGAGGPEVDVEVTRFYNDFKIGLFVGDAVAEVNFDVKVLSANKTILYAKHYEAGATEPNVMLASGSNARTALVKAFRNAVQGVINDSQFQKALAETHGSPAATNVVPPTS